MLLNEEKSGWTELQSDRGWLGRRDANEVLSLWH